MSQQKYSSKRNSQTAWTTSIFWHTRICAILFTVENRFTVSHRVRVIIFPKHTHTHTKATTINGFVFSTVCRSFWHTHCCVLTIVRGVHLQCICYLILFLPTHSTITLVNYVSSHSIHSRSFNNNIGLVFLKKSFTLSLFFSSLMNVKVATKQWHFLCLINFIWIFFFLNLKSNFESLTFSVYLNFWWKFTRLSAESKSMRFQWP